MLLDMTLTYLVDDGDKHFAFGEVWSDGVCEKVYISSRMLKLNNVSQNDIGLPFKVGLSYAQMGETHNRYPMVIRMDRPNGAPSTPFDNLAGNMQRIADELIEDIPNYDVAKVEMALQGIRAAVTGIEVALTPNQFNKVDHLVKQIEGCVSLMADELDVNANE